MDQVHDNAALDPLTIDRDELTAELTDNTNAEWTDLIDQMDDATIEAVVDEINLSIDIETGHGTYSQTGTYAIKDVIDTNPWDDAIKRTIEDDPAIMEVVEQTPVSIRDLASEIRASGLSAAMPNVVERRESVIPTRTVAARVVEED